MSRIVKNGERPFFTVPHIIILGFITAAILVGTQINWNQNQDNCKAILTLSRNLFHQLPAPAEKNDQIAPGVDEATKDYVRERVRIYVQDELGKFYYGQYTQINEAFDLEKRCGGNLPKGTPDPPQKP